MPARKKGDSVVFANDLYGYIASNTTLNKNQVKECFTAYGNLIEDFCSSDNRPSDLIVPIPHVGYFWFELQHGRKKGSTYIMPKNFSRESQKVVLDHDEPDYFKLKFVVDKRLNSALKLKSGRKV